MNLFRSQEILPMIVGLGLIAAFDIAVNGNF